MALNSSPYEADNPFPHKPWFLPLCCTSLLKTWLGKGEIARNEQFLLFPTVFSNCLENFLPYLSNLKMSSANSFSLDKSEVLLIGKGLKSILILIYSFSIHPCSLLFYPG